MLKVSRISSHFCAASEKLKRTTTDTSSFRVTKGFLLYLKESQITSTHRKHHQHDCHRYWRLLYRPCPIPIGTYPSYATVTIVSCTPYKHRSIPYIIDDRNYLTPDTSSTSYWTPHMGRRTASRPSLETETCST